LLFDAEPRHRQKPSDELTSFRAILEGTPPSLEFNQAIWGWFGGRPSRISIRDGEPFAGQLRLHPCAPGPRAQDHNGGDRR
ncbi:MAG: hypothetical protein R6X21_08840, partial [Candidatus Aminicenantes bacterium]